MLLKQALTYQTHTGDMGAEFGTPSFFVEKHEQLLPSWIERSQQSLQPDIQRADFQTAQGIVRDQKAHCALNTLEGLFKSQHGAVEASASEAKGSI